MHVRVGEARAERGDHRRDVADGVPLGGRADDVGRGDRAAHRARVRRRAGRLATAAAEEHRDAAAHPGLADVDVGRPGRTREIGVDELEGDRRVRHRERERRVSRRVQRRHLVPADQACLELRALPVMPSRCQREGCAGETQDERNADRVAESSPGHTPLLSRRRRRRLSSFSCGAGVRLRSPRPYAASC